jgi:tetrapyrrole methylase family protein/MazG family protein/ATP diphosphatase
MSVKDSKRSSFDELLETVRRLLAPDGCPWDREQTFASMKRYLVEESSEVCDAIDALGAEAERPQGPAVSLSAEDPTVAAYREELGDLLMQVVFQCELARSRGWFGIDEVSASIASKLVRRHPHVFGDTIVSNSSEVLKNWENIKKQERPRRGLLSGLARSMPALRWAQRAGEKTSHVGFDWPDVEGPRAKVKEELDELDDAIVRGDRSAIEHELGDVLFSLCNVARKLGLDSEDALRKANARFERRFSTVERRAEASGRSLSEHSLDELDEHWRAAKMEDESGVE